MKARILAPETRKWWTLASLSVALFIMGVLAVWLMLSIGTLIGSGEP